MRKVYIETYGCALNQADSQVIAEELERHGYLIVDRLENANIIIINTCTVRLDTDQRITKRLGQLRQVLSNNKKLIVTGCMARAQPYLIKKTVPEASIVASRDPHRILEAILTNKRYITAAPGETIYNLPRRSIGYTGIIPVNQGCLGKCSFCITRRARRELKSVPPRLVVEHLLDLVKNGAREIYLTSQDAAAYGYDLGSIKLPDLLNYIGDVIDKNNLVNKIFIRVGMMNPWPLIEFVDDFIDTMKHPVFYKFFHIPLQSGDDRVLKIMNRHYSVDDFYEIVRKIRSKIPGAVIATDIIVGHPGEDDDAFRNTMKVLEDILPERIHVAQYTIRPHTPSASMRQVPDPVKKARSKKIIEFMEKRIARMIQEEYIGKKALVLILGVNWRKEPVGRTYNYYPVVIRTKEKIDCIKTKTNVRITDATYYDLKGVLGDDESNTLC